MFRNLAIIVLLIIFASANAKGATSKCEGLLTAIGLKISNYSHTRKDLTQSEASLKWKTIFFEDYSKSSSDWNKFFIRSVAAKDQTAIYSSLKKSFKRMNDNTKDELLLRFLYVLNPSSGLESSNFINSNFLGKYSLPIEKSIALIIKDIANGKDLAKPSHKIIDSILKSDISSSLRFLRRVVTSGELTSKEIRNLASVYNLLSSEKKFFYSSDIIKYFPDQALAHISIDKLNYKNVMDFVLKDDLFFSEYIEYIVKKMKVSDLQQVMWHLLHSTNIDNSIDIFKMFYRYSVENKKRIFLFSSDPTASEKPYDKTYFIDVLIEHSLWEILVDELESFDLLLKGERTLGFSEVQSIHYSYNKIFGPIVYFTKNEIEQRVFWDIERLALSVMNVESKDLDKVEIDIKNVRAIYSDYLSNKLFMRVAKKAPVLKFDDTKTFENFDDYYLLISAILIDQFKININQSEFQQNGHSAIGLLLENFVKNFDLLNKQTSDDLLQGLIYNNSISLDLTSDKHILKLFYSNPDIFSAKDILQIQSYGARFYDAESVEESFRSVLKNDYNSLSQFFKSNNIKPGPKIGVIRKKIRFNFIEGKDLDAFLNSL